MAEIEITRANRDQMAEVAEVFSASRLHALPYLPELHTREETLHYFTHIVFDENEVFLARERPAGRILGFIAFSGDWVHHLYLLPASRGQGIGRLLLDVARRETPTLHLWTFQRNLAARRFYEKQGFQVIEETDGSGNEEKEPDVLLRWTRAAWSPTPQQRVS